MRSNGLSSLLGGLTQGIGDFGKSVVDMFGTGGAAIGDLIQSGGRSTKNQDDFRKWLYGANSVKDASAKGLGTTLNGVNTVVDFIPGARFVSATPVGNAVQGAVSGLSDELKFNGENADWGKAGQRAALGATTGLAGGMAGKAFGSPMNQSLKNAIARGATTGAVTGGLASGGNRFIEGGDFGDVLGSTLQGAGTGAFLGGAGSAFRQFNKPQTYKNASADEQSNSYRNLNEMTVPEMKKELSEAWTPIYAPDQKVLARKNALRQRINSLEAGYDNVDDYLRDATARRASEAPALAKTSITNASQVDPDVIKAYGGAENVQKLIDNDVDPLVLYHAVRGDKLGLAIDTLDDNIVNPSLQAVNPNASEGGDFGDVILLGDKKMAFRNTPSGAIDTSEAPTLYDRDVFSPSMPNVHIDKDGTVRGFVGGEWNPQNVSDYMNKLGNQASESEAADPATFAAFNAKRFENLADAVNSRDKLKSNAEAVKSFEKYNKNLLDKFGEINSNIVDIDEDELYPASTPQEGIQAIQYALSHPGEIEFMDEMLEDPKVKRSVNEAIEMSKDVPTEYFEAKVNRPVKLSEFPGAVLPEGYQNEQVLNALDRNKIPVVGYYNDSVKGKTLQDVLKSLSKRGNRFDTPYLLSLLAMLGGGAALANQTVKEDEEKNKNQGVYY